MPYRPIRTIIKDQKLITCAGSTTVVEASRLMRVNQIGALMIVDEGRLAGIFTERDALFRVIANERDAKPRSLQRPAPQGKSGSATGLTVPRGPREAVKVPRSEAIWFYAGHEESTRQGNFHQTPPD